MSESVEVLKALEAWYSKDTFEERLGAFSWLGGVIQVTPLWSREWGYYCALQDMVLETPRTCFLESAKRSLPFGGSALLLPEPPTQEKESYW